MTLRTRKGVDILYRRLEAHLVPRWMSVSRRVKKRGGESAPVRPTSLAGIITIVWSPHTTALQFNSQMNEDGDYASFWYDTAV
jgi:hypothetical protein